ncbi:hypothetical protein GN244_ATG11036 [Phytophthora infestans]|uniref:Uncharacterized protein n=1 Tax=Phytophthora infestans TaxID=4787 RepID=A0A833S0C3_PHYIN|nr:hypothetical protein GN244_ATG11036 [Phytophthora infestans]
MRSRVTNHF